MEVYTCYCQVCLLFLFWPLIQNHKHCPAVSLFLQGDLCNEPTFLLAKFNEWISVTRARLKAGPSHPLDILITIATVAVGGFFFLVIASQIAKIFSKKKEEEDDEEDDEEEEDKADSEDTKEGEEGTAGHAKSE